MIRTIRVPPKENFRQTQENLSPTTLPDADTRGWCPSQQTPSNRVAFPLDGLLQPWPAGIGIYIARPARPSP